MIAPLPLQHVGQTAVDQLVRAFGIDVALVVHAQCELRQILPKANSSDVGLRFQ